MASAFFGGVFAVVVIGVANIVRLRAPVWHVLALLAGATCYVIGCYLYLLSPNAEESTLRLFDRMGGFALMGVLYLLHRREYRAMNVMGTEAPSPYLPVIGACIVGLAAFLLMVANLSWATG